MRSQSRSPLRKSDKSRNENYKSSRYRSRSRSRSRSRHRDKKRDFRSPEPSRSQYTKRGGRSYSNDHDDRDYRELENQRKNERQKNRERKYEASKNDVERWPNDMYQEQNAPCRGFSSNRTVKKSTEDQFMDSRRFQREVIGSEGAEYVWGKSPPRHEV